MDSAVGHSCMRWDDTLNYDGVMT